MSKREQRLELFLVAPTVTDENTFLVSDIPNILRSTFHTGISIQTMTAYILQRSGESKRQTARRIYIAYDNGCQCIACFAAKEPSLNDTRNLINPRHGYRIS